MRLFRPGRFQVIVVAIALAWACFDAAGVACPPRYTVEIMYGPACGSSVGNAGGFGLNNSGVTCGWDACPGGYSNAFVCYDGTTLTPIALPSGMFHARAADVNDQGVVTGFGQGGIPGLGDLGFVRDGVSLTTIMPLSGGNWVESYSINSNKVAVGNYGNISTGPFPVAFRWQDGAMQDLTPDFPLPGMSTARAINESGQITGYMGETTYPPNYHAYIWTKGKVVDLGTPFPQCYATDGTGINNKGQACGWWRRPLVGPIPFGIQAFFFDGHDMIDLGLAPGFKYSYALGLNDSGDVVGSFGNDNNFGYGCIWRGGNLYVLDDLLPPSTHLHVDAAFGINDAGQIVGHGTTTDTFDDVSLLLTPILGMIGDATCDERVDIDDLFAVINNWGGCPSPQESECDADLDSSGAVNAADLMAVIDHWDF